jgi:hypothetical protein
VLPYEFEPFFRTLIKEIKQMEIGAKDFVDILEYYKQKNMIQ